MWRKPNRSGWEALDIERRLLYSPFICLGRIVGFGPIFVGMDETETAAPSLISEKFGLSEVRVLRIGKSTFY